MGDNILRASFTSEEPFTLKAMVECMSKLERYEKIEQIINEYKRQPSRNVFTNDKYFQQIIDIFSEVD